MAYFAISPCIGCGRTFTYNPHKVPSLPASASPTGEKEPICADCVKRANPERVKRGLAPINVLPGAYDPEPEATDSDQPYNEE